MGTPVRTAPDRRMIEKALTSLRKVANDEGDTAEELAAKVGHDVKWVHKRLKAAKAQGKLIVGRAQRERLDGKTTTVPVYRIAK